MLWTELPKEFQDWEILELPKEEFKIGAGNCEVLNNDKVALVEGANKTAEAISKRGVDPVMVPYRTIYETTGSGIHCSVMSLWREW